MKIIFIFLLGLFLVEGLPISEGKSVLIDMNRYQTISFDSLISDMTCTILDKTPFDNCKNMIPHKDYLYFMGSTRSGNNVYIYDKTGKFLKEIIFPDALLVNSMCIVSEPEELWVVSRFKIINKFKPDGTPIKKVTLPFPCAAIMPVDKQDFLVYSGGAHTERGSIEGHFMALTDFKSIQRLYMPAWGNDEWPFAPYSLFATDKENTIFILPDNTDTIYIYDRPTKEIQPYYSLGFHGNFLTKDKKPQSDKRMSEIITEKRYIHNIYSFFTASNHFFFKLTGKRNDFCAIRREDNALFSFDRLFDHFRSAYVNPFVGADNENLYLLARENELAEHYMNIKCTYPVIRNLLPALSVDGSRWVLLTIKIKG